MKRLKFIAICILTLLIVTLYQIPDPSPGDPLLGYQNLPDADLRALAEEEWQASREDSALLLLDYLIAIQSPDSPAARQQRDSWLEELKSRKSVMGRMKSAGWGALTGEVDSFESLAGSSLADLIVYGDLRDLVRETFIEDDTDEFIVLLSTVGVLTTVFPPVDPAVSLLKAAKRTGSLSGPFLIQIKQVLTMMKESKNTGAAVAMFKQHLMPVLELAKRCRNFSEFQTIMKVVKNSDQLKILIKMADSTRGGARKMAQIFTVASKEGEALATASINYLMRHGQAGMDTLYGALRKGPKGLRFVAENPTLVVRGIKNVAKSRNWVMNEAVDKYHAAYIRYGKWIIWLKMALTALLAAGLAIMVLPARLFQLAKSKGSGKVRGLLGSPKATRIFAMLALGLVLYFILSITKSGPMQDDGNSLASISPTTSVSATGGAWDSSGPSISMVFIALALVAQTYIWLRTRSRLQAIGNEPGLPPSQRLHLLENQETLLDLPLFVGLGFTVFAFILISVNAEMSRILAYTSTVVGILSSVSLRLCFFHPLREDLIRGQSINS